MADTVGDQQIDIELHKVTTKNKGNKEQEPYKRESSSSIVIAAEELKFKAQTAANKIKKQAELGKLSKKEKNEKLKQAYKTLAHTYNKKDLPLQYETNLVEGLSTDEYNEKLDVYGLNQLTPPKVTPWYVRLFLAIFAGFFNVLLWFGSLLCFIAYGVDPSDIPDSTNLYLGIVLAVVVTLTGVFGYFQESKSADLMGSLQAMNKSSDIEVIRDCKSIIVEPINLVPGDIVIITSGQSVPADVRIFECSPDLEVNNSSLTGESEPIKRDWKPERTDIVPGEAGNLMFFGTSVVNGKGKGVVFATGDNTFMGRTAALATSTDNESTPIAKEIKDFVLKVSGIAFALGITFFIWGLADGVDFVPNVIFLIGIIVANVPEGLLATVTVSLTLTASKMFEKNVRVKNLESVETLGSTSVICSDKTGTLTTSIMTCQHIFYNLKECLCETSQPMQSLKGDFYDNNERRTDFLKLIRCGALCNNADFVNEPNNPEIHGTVQSNANPTEAAMVKFSSGHIAAEYKITVPEYRNEHKKLHEIPFNSKNKWQVSVHELNNKYIIKDECKINQNKVAIVQMKGAPERILALCDKYAHKGESKNLNDDIRKQIMDGVLNLGSRGERVLALAELILDENEFNINIEEPKVDKPIIDDIDMQVNGDTIFVKHNNDKIEIDCSDIKNDEGKVVTFNDIYIKDIKIKLSNKIGIKHDAIRLYYGDTKESLLNENTLNECGIKKGSILLCLQGPYIFKGTSKDDINFPFKRNNEIGLQFVGLYAMIDPPRPGVPEAVYKCQSAGIKVIMVTGDHPVTAKAIAEQVGIIGPNAKTLEDVAKEKYGGTKGMVKLDEYNAIVVPGWELQEILEGDKHDRQTIETFWNNTLTKDNIVFARTSPQQKLLIVSAVQDRGGIVAVTGDGVNDSPALKKADIGVAMGITGTDVAKESADMILLDDNFASIVNGIEEGRIIFDNLKKSIAYTLSSNIPEIAPFILFQTIRIPLPLTTTMILLVDLGTDLAPAISMAYEGRESNIMSRPPRDPEIHKLVTWKLVSFAYLQIGVLQALAGFYAYFVVLSSYGLHYTFLPGLDTHDTFTFAAKEHVLRDAYWLWCWDNEGDKSLWSPKQCIYTPEFEFNWQSESFYDQNMFESWIDTNQEYAKETKDHMWNACQADTTCVTTNLKDRSMLNGDIFVESGIGYHLTWDNSVNATTNECINVGATTCTSVRFDNIWKNNIEPIYRTHLHYSEVYDNRRCELSDYANEYGTFGSKTPVLCNKFDHDIKPRTYDVFPNSGNIAQGGVININTVTPTNIYSLFPMQMKTRTETLAKSNSAYFISIIIVQWADLMICKTRERSLFEQGMTNVFMNYALIFETILGAFLVYVPASNIVTGTSPVQFVWWVPAIPFSLMIYIYDEVRKGIIRKYPRSWLQRNTFW